MLENRIIVHPSLRQEKLALKKLSLSVNVFRYTTDMNGTILADAAIPASEKKPFPFHLFGDFDRQSGYALADMATNQAHNTNLLSVFVQGVGMPLLLFNPLANIYSQFKKGDMVFVYADNLVAPNFLTWVVVQAIIAGYASLVSQSNITQLDDKGPWGVFQNNHIAYKWQHDDQLHLPLTWIIADGVGGYKSDNVSPEGYRYTIENSDVKKIIIPLEFICNQYFGLSSFLDYNNQLLNLNFALYV